jgi:hypothetical protein
MTTTTHTLKFKADNREVKVMGQTIEKAFDPRSSRQFRQEMGNLQRRLKDIAAAQVTLVRALQRTEEGTDEFKKLEKQLKGVENQAKTVKSAIGGITQAFKDLQGERRRGFGAGLAQGLGVAQYIPSEPGMGRRIAGGLVGGGIRRMAGTAQGVISQPGIGGLTTALSAIPIVGQMAAGAVQALSGMYQEAVAYHQARVENLSYLQGGAIAAASRARGTGIKATTAASLGVSRQAMGKGIVGTFARSVARDELERELWEPRVVGGRVVEGGPAAEASPYAKRAQAELERLERQERIALGAGKGIRTGQRTAEFLIPALRVAREQGLAKEIVADPKVIKERFRKLRNQVLDNVAESIVKDVAKEAKSTASRERAARFSAAFWREAVQLPGAGFGARFGFRAAETQAQLSGFMQARGGEYTRLTRRQFEGALAARRVYGIQAQTAGAFARMGLEGGGGVGAMDLATTLQMAFEIGLRGSQVPEYLQALVSLGQTAEKQGVKINEREFGRSAALMKSVGLRGPQIGRVTSGLQQAGMDLSQRGVSSPVDMIMMRAAGYDPSQGIEGYATAMNKLAGGMDLDTLNNLMSMATSGSRGGIGAQGRQTSILMMRRLFGRLKTPIGPGQASTMLDAYQQGKLGREHLAMLGRDIDQGERRGAHTRMVAGARIGVGAVAGLTQVEAGLEAQRIAAGAKFAGVMKNLNQATINAANAANNFNGELKAFSEWMADLTKKLGEVTKGGAEGTWNNFKNWILGRGSR